MRYRVEANDEELVSTKNALVAGVVAKAFSGSAVYASSGRGRYVQLDNIAKLLFTKQHELGEFLESAAKQKLDPPQMSKRERQIASLKARLEALESETEEEEDSNEI